jgi:hypothetical protein
VFSGITPGRGFDWKTTGEQYHLADQDGRVVVRLVPEGDDGWWIASPRLIPELPIFPNLDVAKRAALTVALWALPLDRDTAAKQRAKNTIPPTDQRSCDLAHSVPFSSSTWQPSASINAAAVPGIPEFLRRRKAP